jgi:hypothetical protein
MLGGVVEHKATERRTEIRKKQSKNNRKWKRVPINCKYSQVISSSVSSRVGPEGLVLSGGVSAAAPVVRLTRGTRFGGRHDSIHVLLSPTPQKNIDILSFFHNCSNHRRLWPRTL